MFRIVNFVDGTILIVSFSPFDFPAIFKGLSWDRSCMRFTFITSPTPLEWSEFLASHRIIAILCLATCPTDVTAWEQLYAEFVTIKQKYSVAGGPFRFK